MDGYAEEALTLESMIMLIDYDEEVIDEDNSNILSSLCGYLVDIQDDDIDDDYILKEYTEAYNVSERLFNAFMEYRVREEFIELLKEYELYEVLSYMDQ